MKRACDFCGGAALRLNLRCAPVVRDPSARVRDAHFHSVCPACWQREAFRHDMVLERCPRDLDDAERALLVLSR